MQKSMPVGMWIGLYREGSDWYWADNSLFDFTYWENRVPDRYGGVRKARRTVLEYE